MNTTNTMVSVECGKCSGSGKYYFRGGSDVCYPCNGAGQIRMRKEKLDAMKAAAARMETYRAEENAREDREAAAMVAAESVIDARGIQGAREFFAAHRTDADALAGLINAMRNARLFDASNAVVRHRNALVGAR